MPKLEYTLAAVNARLKANNTKVVLEQRGSSLSMRATLPPKPGSNRIVPYQQRIALNLPANPDGLKRAEKDARLLGARLATKEFDWIDYEVHLVKVKHTAKDVIKEFEKDYRSRNELKQSTWNENWAKIFKRLPPNKKLTTDILIGQVLKQPHNTRMRQQTCQRLQKLADFAQIEVDLMQYQGNYGPSKVQDRELPSDELIVEWFERIPNKGWRWVYGIMAAAGLRPHEAFFCEWVPEGLQVLKGKTGPRLVFQLFYPEWVEAWGLKNICRPRIDAEHAYTKGNLGKKINNQFHRYGLPFQPYDLRHAFAIRTSVNFNLPETVSANLMGHTPSIHLARYHKHISLAHSQQAVKRALNSADRPTPPKQRDDGSVL
ncbi:site-specific integrase [Leptothoe spongobia]|uniref:Site-specific integrase n=1 Tax=Leptothoe spongobia TAU-MAC 1115 TaxID=1967444 RepID=A0A947DGA6_9CYAN|nr:site-specific integrase [Leptothoe spongobia]MBT9316215.1 site-specific integrase [Leptothoe spongobia TAU-MAC 1115]